MLLINVVNVADKYVCVTIASLATNEIIIKSSEKFLAFYKQIMDAHYIILSNYV